MADNITELFNAAKNKGVLKAGMTETMFREQTASDEGLKSFYDYASEHGMKLRPYPDFVKKARGTIEQEPQKPVITEQPQAAEQPVTDTRAAVAPQPQQENKVDVTAQPTLTNPYDQFSDNDLRGIEQNLLETGKQKRQKLIDDAKNVKQSGVAALFNAPQVNSQQIEEMITDEGALNDTEREELKQVRETLGRRAAERGFDAEKKLLNKDTERVNAKIKNLKSEGKGNINLESAQYLNKKAEEILNAPSKFDNKDGMDAAWQGVKNMWSGIENDLFDRQTLSLIDLQRNVRLAKIVEKLNGEKELNDDEAEFLNAYLNLANAQATRQNDLSLGYKMGQGAAQSVPFMIDMFLTKNLIGAPAKKTILKTVTKNLGEAAGKNWAKWLGMEGKRSIGQYLAYEAAATPIQTGVMASSWSQVFEDKANNMLESGNTDWDFKDFSRSMTNMYVETLTERAGGKFIDDVARLIPSIGKIWGNNQIASAVTGYIQDPLTETAEEYLGAGINAIRSLNPLYSKESNEQMLGESKEMLTPEGFAQTFGTILPMTLFGGAVNMGTTWYAGYQYSNAREKLRSTIEGCGATAEQAENIMSQLEKVSADPNQFNDYIGKTFDNLFSIYSQDGKKSLSKEEYTDLLHIVYGYERTALNLNTNMAQLKELMLSLTPEQKAEMQAELDNAISALQQVPEKAAAQQAAAEIDTQTNPNDNQIHAVYIGNNQDDQAFIVGGQVEYAEDGTIDRTNSSPYVYIRKMSDNKVVSIPTKDLTSMGAPMDANQVKANAEAHAAAVAGVKQTFQVGDEIQLQGQLQNVTDQSATIEDIDEDGNVTFTTDQGPVTVPADFVLANFQPASPVQTETTTQDQHNIIEWKNEDGRGSIFAYLLEDGTWQVSDENGNAQTNIPAITEEDFAQQGFVNTAQQQETNPAAKKSPMPHGVEADGLFADVNEQFQPTAEEQAQLNAIFDQMVAEGDTTLAKAQRALQLGYETVRNGWNNYWKQKQQSQSNATIESITPEVEKMLDNVKPNEIPTYIDTYIQEQLGVSEKEAKDIHEQIYNQWFNKRWEFDQNGNAHSIVDEMNSAKSYDEKEGTELHRFLSYITRGKKLLDNESWSFKLGKSKDILTGLGIVGDIYATTNTINPKKHTQDDDHKLGVREWFNTITQINNPIAVTRYKDADNKYRIYTNATINGKNICVGVDVNSVGNEIQVTDIVTAFGRDIKKIQNASNEELIYPKTEQAPDQFSQGPNSPVYDQVPETADKGTTNNSNTQINQQENAEKVQNNAEIQQTKRQKRLVEIDDEMESIASELETLLQQRAEDEKTLHIIDDPKARADRDAEIIRLGTRYAVKLTQKGIYTMLDFCDNMINKFSNYIRPFLKSLYMAAKFAPDNAANLAKFDTEADIMQFDVDNYDREEVVEKMQEQPMQTEQNAEAPVANQEENLSADEKYFVDYLAKQKLPKETAKTNNVSVGDYVSDDVTGKPAMIGVYHGDGYDVATDAHILFAEKANYPSDLEGKCIVSDKTKEKFNKKNIDHIGYNNETVKAFPNWRKAVPVKDNASIVTPINTSDLRNFLTSAEKDLKSKWEEGKASAKKNGEKFSSYKEFSNDAQVAIRFSNGGVGVYGFRRIQMFADAIDRIGATEIYTNEAKEGYIRALTAENENGVALIMPIITKTYEERYNEYPHYEYDLKYENSTLQNENKSQKVLQNEGKSVPLQSNSTKGAKVEEHKLDKNDYTTYLAEGANEAIIKANPEKFANYAHQELAFVSQAAWDGVKIPVDVLMQQPAIAEAQQKIDEKEGSATISSEQTAELVTRLLNNQGEVKKEKKAFFVIGRPAGGKSTVFAEPIAKENGAAIIDSDDVKPWIEGYDNGYGAGYVQQVSSDIADEALKYAVSQGYNIVIPKIGGNSVVKQAIKLKQQGYRVELYFNEVSPESSIMRAASRFAQKGRYLSLSYLQSIGDKPNKTFINYANKTLQDAEIEIKSSGQTDVSGHGSSVQSGRNGSNEISSRENEGVMLFDYAEWKNNDVPFGSEPKHIWDSNSGLPIPGTNSVRQQQQTNANRKQEPIDIQGALAKQAFIDRMTNMFIKAALETKEKPLKSILDIRNLAKESGIEVDSENRDDIKLQEYVEDAIVRSARKIVEKLRAEGASQRTIYDAIISLYEIQPTISRRSAERLAKQQYSTPVPMSFLADMFVYRDNMQIGLEPTAGNGMLVFGIPSNKIDVNEIDQNRLNTLKGGHYANVTEQDATIPFNRGKAYDFVITNPPFGSFANTKHGDYIVPGLEQNIAINALDQMKDDGRAAIIVGGNMDYAPNGGVSSDKSFYGYLYDNYNVVGVIDMSGDLYEKQGTSFPTRMILINGRRTPEEIAKERIYPPVQSKALPKATTFGELYDIIDKLNNSNSKTNGHAVLRTGASEMPISSQPQGTTNEGGRNIQPDQVDEIIQRVRTRLDSGNKGELATTTGNDNANKARTSNKRGSDAGLGRNINGRNGGERTTGEQPTTNSGSRTGVVSDNGTTGGVLNNGRTGSTTLREPVRVERKLDQSKLPYVTHNNAFSLESVAPAAMVEAMDENMKRIEAEVGDIDTFVTNQLGYASIDEMHKALAAEQVDSVAMAIYQMSKGDGMIIGDQTGVGKGRQMAALIRWAVRNGKRPIFVTQKADLFSDIYRDLNDIGSGDLKPFIFNSDGAMTDNDGKVVYSPLRGEAQKKIFESGELPAEYDYVVLTYSQIQTGDELSRTPKKEPGQMAFGRVVKERKPRQEGFDIKAKFFRQFAKDNYVMFDESHTAAGAGQGGAFLRSVMPDIKGVTFASATFAKRPDTMPLYAIKTAMGKANVEMPDLIEIIQKGGVTLQEIMSRALSAAGQMVRRERDMSDVVTDWETISDPDVVEASKREYDNAIKAFGAIIDFQTKYIDPFIQGVRDDLATTMGDAVKKKGTDKLGINNTPFASKIYNYTKQLMLALKSSAIVDKVESEIKAGRHPVIALENTMEASLKEYPIGGTINEPTFAASLLRGLDSTLSYTKKNDDGSETHWNITPAELGREGEMAYYDLRDFIKESTKNIFISPLDDIIDGLRQRGYKVGELTGRKTVAVKNSDGTVTINTRSDRDKKRLAREFNNGQLDVLILNKSASTGISLHASKTFKDQRQRTMIIAQPLSDINDYMQMIGRIDRTGQVARGYYIVLGLPVPAESRLMMMLSTKLKSLNANTTTSQENEDTDVKAPDLLNKYGSQAVVEYLIDNPDLYTKLTELGLKIGDGEKKGMTIEELAEYKPSDDSAIRKTTGYVALLSTKEQEKFYSDIVDRYNSLMQYLNDTGSNDLKITTMPLRAKLLSRKVSSEGKEPYGNNPFAQNAYLETVEVDVLRKPMKSDEIQKGISTLKYGGNTGVKALTEQLVKDTDNKLKEEEKRYAESLERAKREKEQAIKTTNAKVKLSQEEKTEEINKKIENIDSKVEEMHQSHLNKIRFGSRDFRYQVSRFNTNRTYLIPDNLNSNTFSTSSPAIFMGYKGKDEKLTPSTTMAVFAVMDSRRKLEIKMTDVEALNSIANHTDQNYNAAQSVNIDNWDSQVPTENRRTAYILTGNILQAFSDSRNEDGGLTGQLISYTDIDGGIHDGILMPDNWNPMLLRNNGVPINARLADAINGSDLVAIDGSVKIAAITNPDGTYRYKLYVPSTKSAGSKYFDNESLVQLTNNGFDAQVGDKFTADVSRHNLEYVVRLLANMGVRVYDKTDSDNKYSVSQFEKARKGNMDDYDWANKVQESLADIFPFECIALTNNDIHSGYAEQCGLNEDEIRDLLFTMSVGRVHAFYNKTADRVFIPTDMNTNGAEIIDDIKYHESIHEYIYHNSDAQSIVSDIASKYSNNQLKLACLTIGVSSYYYNKYNNDSKNKDLLDEIIAHIYEFSNTQKVRPLEIMSSILMEETDKQQINKIIYGNEKRLADFASASGTNTTDSRTGQQSGQGDGNNSQGNRFKFVGEQGRRSVERGDKSAEQITETFTEHLRNRGVDVELVDAEEADNMPIDSAEYQIVTNKEELSELDNDPKGYVEAYCTLAKIDGKYYSPMATLEKDETGKNQLTQPIESGKWYKSDERTTNDPLVREKADGTGWEYHLIKPDGTDMWVAYDPYWHSTTSPLNDQFTSAWRRPELVTVKVLIPRSDMESGYKADGALLSTGEHDWNSGPVSASLKASGKGRKVILSQYRKIVGEVSAKEEAQNIANYLEGTFSAIPINAVRPQVRDELIKLGVKFTDINGNAGNGTKELNNILSKLGTQYVKTNKKNKKIEFQNGNGVVYGWYKNGKIYLVKGRLNPNTAVHEASHMLSAIMREVNPKGWADIVRLCKESKALWDEVVNDPNYNLTTDDEIASEIISRYSGKRGAEKLTQAMNDAIKQDDSLANVSRARVIYNNVREALHKFWGWVTDLFNTTSFKNLDEVADMYLDELLNTTQLPTPPRGGRSEEQRIEYPKPEVGESISDYTARVARVRDDMRTEEAVNAYMAEMAKLRGNKIGNVETGARAEYTRWIDAASPIENFQKYFKGENDIPSEQDAYNDTFLSQGRISFNQEVYERTFIRPMRDAVKAIMDSGKLNGLDVKWQNLTDEEQKKDKDRKNGQQLTPRELIGVYCQAKDVQECAEKGLPDRGAEGFTFLLGKSHEVIIEMVENAVPAEMINDLWKSIRNATSFALDYQVNNGYITPEERAIYNRDYYVPERGWTERDFAVIESTYYQFGKYYNQPYNKALRRARGRKSLASDPFGYIWNIADSTINSVEKNKTKVKLLEYCLEHEQEGAEAGAFRVAKFWVLKNLDENGDPIMTSQEDPVTGELVQVPSTSISYAEPTADMFRHDQELRDEIEKKERKFTKLAKEKAQWQKVADDINTNDLIHEVATNKIADYDTKLETLGKEIQDLRDKIQILSTKEYEGLPMLTNDEDKQHRVYAVKDGQKYELWFKDARIAQAINKDYDKWTAANNGITRTARQATRLLSAALTQYNPEFAASNFARDFQVALVSIAAEKGADWEKEFMKQFNNKQLQAAVWAYAMNDKIKNQTEFKDTKYGEYLNEYFSHGAQTGFSFLKNLDVMQQNFNEMINEGDAKKYAKATLGALSMLTEVSETAIRFAGYVTAREKGNSADEAAIFAKELTTNFDRGGELSKSSLMAMWSFFRATINGNLKFIKGFKNYAKGYGIAAAAYFVMGMLNALCNPDDPEDEIYFSNYVRMSNFVLGKLFGITAKVPVAHFLRMFFAMGNNVAQYGLGRKSGEKAMYDTVLFCGDELLPNWLNVTNFIEYDPRSNNASLNGKQYVQTAMPTPIAPIVDNALNIDFTGRAIDGRSYYYPTEANHKPILQYRKDTPDWMIKMCQGIYQGLGGDLKVNNISDDNVIQRLFDNSPSKVQHFIEGYRPPFADLIFATGALINKATDENATINANDVPFLRKFYSDYKPDRVYANEYWMLSGRVDSYEQLLKDTRKGNRSKYNEMTKSDEYKVYQKAQRELNRQGKKAKSTPENIKNLMNLNKEWNKAY